MRQWVSLHLFYHDISGHDRLLAEVVQPAVSQLRQEGWLAQFFFVRYLEGGPHIRVRLYGEKAGWQGTATDYLTERFHAFTQATPSRITLQQAEFQRALPPYVAAQMESEAPWFPNHSVQSIAYVPEVDRYGGTDAVPISETLFFESSVLTLQSLAAVAASPSKRMGLALEVMLLTALGFGTPRRHLGAYLARYGEMMGRLSGEAPRAGQEAHDLAVQRGEKLAQRLNALLAAADARRLPAAYATWHAAVLKASSDLAALEEAGRLEWPSAEIPEPYRADHDAMWLIPAIGVGHMHMTNNRMGVSMYHEAVLAQLASMLLKEGREEA